MKEFTGVEIMDDRRSTTDGYSGEKTFMLTFPFMVQAMPMLEELNRHDVEAEQTQSQATSL